MKRTNNKFELREQNSKKLERVLEGKGVYIYENNTNGELTLPRISKKGVSKIAPKNTPGCRFEGDDYYLKLVPFELKLIEVINTENEEKMNEQKLILDQPDCVTNEGKVERVIVEPAIKLNDNTNSEPQKDILISEAPLDGVDIILG